jgi:hypothetical protein
MLLVNRDGRVMQTWVGKLAPDKQNQTLKVIAPAHVETVLASPPGAAVTSVSDTAPVIDSSN